MDALPEHPAFSAFLDLVRLADHPGDAACHRHFQKTPLAALFAGKTAPELATEMSALLDRRGLAGTLLALRAALPEDPAAAWGGAGGDPTAVETAFADLVRRAGDFERARGPSALYSDFAAEL